MLEKVYLIQMLACFSMVSVIWMVQLLVYPNFRWVTPANFRSFHQFHTEKITWVVGPLMLIEILSAGYLCFHSSNLFWTLNLFSVGILWLLTALISVPIHHQLTEAGEDSRRTQLMTQLIRTNWYRTLLWSLRGIVLLGLSFQDGHAIF